MSVRGLLVMYAHPETCNLHQEFYIPGFNFFFDFRLSFLIGEARTCVREITCSFLKKERTASKEARKDDT